MWKRVEINKLSNWSVALGSQIAIQDIYVYGLISDHDREGLMYKTYITRRHSCNLKYTDPRLDSASTRLVRRDDGGVGLVKVIIHFHTPLGNQSICCLGRHVNIFGTGPGGVMVERSLGVRKVTGSIPSRDRPKVVKRWYK